MDKAGFAGAVIEGAAMGTGAVAGSVNGLTQAAVKISQDKAGTNYQKIQ